MNEAGNSKFGFALLSRRWPAVDRTAAENDRFGEAAYGADLCVECRLWAVREDGPIV
ncbi:hypothetical protein KO498_15815 [Lentibacter algarum]|uniref:hypothetical protein n=1 Tax=Lentibacter algarum TaxID=576131 RepID=UPI001C09CC76|nr:hypothetical protein [Lentibacter algarum]MBU2983274.1 hypothetical protein [Lentibacter algarum]